MSSPTIFSEPVSFQGEVKIARGLTRANIAPELSRVFPVPLTEVRVWNAFQTPLGTAGNDDLGITAGAFATGCPYITAGDLQSAGPTTRYGRFIYQIPVEYDDGQPFSQQEVDRTGIVSDYARAALHNVERYRNAKERAFIDDVTEIYNVRYLLSTTENEIQRADRYKNPLSVLFLDLDRFKLVNDRYGHLIGSQTLRSLSQLFLQCVRQVDTLARYGGDEFTILLVDTGHDAAMTIAQRIRRTVEANVFEAGAEAKLRLTISIGVATFPEHGRERDALLDAADKAMYRAKSLGRNRACSASDL